MKFKVFVTVTHTLLGAALLGYGQQQHDRNAVGGNPTADEVTGQPAGSSTPRQQTNDPQASPPTGGTLGNRPTNSDSETNTATDSQADRPTTSKSATGGSGSENKAQKRSSAQMDPEVDWEKAEKKDMPMSQIPERARNTLTTVTKDGKLAEQVTRLTKDEHEVFKATVNRENEKDLHIFVKEDGTVVKTKQMVDLASAPESVRNTVESKMGKDSPDAKEVHRVIANDETTYVVSKTAKEGNERKKLVLDNTGKVIEKKDKMEKNQMNRKDADRDADQTDRPASSTTGDTGTGTTNNQDRN